MSTTTDTSPRWLSPVPGWRGIAGLRTQAAVNDSVAGLLDWWADTQSPMSPHDKLFVDVTPSEPLSFAEITRDYDGEFVRYDSMDGRWFPFDGFGPGWASERLSLVIVSGGSEPLHPAWIRGIRDQCQAAGVRFALRTWGEWAPIGPVSGLTLEQANGEPHWFKNEGGVIVRRVGSAHSGDLLDGQRWPVPEGF